MAFDPTALITLGASLLAAIIDAITKATGWTKEEALAALTADMSATLVDKAAAEAKEKAVVEGTK